MRYYLLIFLLSLFACNSNNNFQKKEILSPIKKEKKYQEILSKNITSLYNLSITYDSVLMSIEEDFTEPIRFYNEMFIFNKNYNFTIYKYRDFKVSHVEKVKKWPLIVETIDSYKFKYDTLSQTDINLLSKFGVNWDYLKCKKFESLFFLHDNLVNSTIDKILIVDKNRGIRDSIILSKPINTMEVKNFFLFDVTDDSFPEVFILHTIGIGKEGALGLSIYGMKE